MDTFDFELTSVSLNFSESYFLPYNYGSVNATIPTLTSSTSITVTDEILHNNFITEAVLSGVKVQRLDRGPPSGRRVRPGSLEDSPLQMVSRQVKDKVCFVFVMILIPCFCVFGSVGNILSLRVLVHHRMRNSTNMVLASLSVSDLLFLLHALYFSCLRLYAQRNPMAGEALRSMTFPVLGPYGSVVTARITTGLTTMLSLERLIAVYFPIKAKVMCSKAMTITGITMIYLVTAIVFIPNALKYHSYYVTVNNQTMHTMGLTELGLNNLFYTIYGNILNVLFRLIPILILILVNIFIALAIRRTWSLRKTMSSGGSTSYEQNRITLMLLMVSLVFLICILPGAVHSIVDQIYKQYSSFGHQSNMYDVVRNVTYFLETVNSSVNFVIYMAFSTKFCRTYKQIFCCMEQSNKSQNSARPVIRISSRPQSGSRSSMTSYRELYFLNQLSNRKVFCLKDRDTKEKTVSKNGLVANAGTILEESGKVIFKSKCSSSDSCSGHSNSRSHSGHNTQSKGKRFSQHSINSVHSNHSMEHTAAEMYS